MILLELFFTFLKIGALSFGGGMGMISLIREEVLGHGWMTEADLLNMIAVAESTPGPIAVNIATFIGADEGGIAGAALATLGVVLPSFVIILVIAALVKNLLKYEGVKAFLGGVRPCVIGLILAVAATLGLGTLLGIGKIGDALTVDWRGIAIFAAVAVSAAVLKKIRKKPVSPIVMILISAVLGMILYPIGV
ncbi:MAG: chromate transporter [Clostridia bacterium]|nr:chromate transporter [Clostridia bacterium]